MQQNLWLAKPYGLANQKFCYIQMRLDIEKSGEWDKERSKEWLVNSDPWYNVFLWVSGGLYPITGQQGLIVPL